MSNTSSDDFLGGKLKIKQPISGYRAGIDPVLLSAMLADDFTGEVLDLGCGVGIVGLCALSRISNIKVTGIEKQASSVELAKQNIIANNMQNSYEVFIKDICNSEQEDPIKGRMFNAVLTNPPWFESNNSKASKQSSRATARHETDNLLELWLNYAIKKLAPKGRLVIIHRVARLPNILQYIDNRVGNIKVIPLVSKRGIAAKNMILSAQKDRKTPFAIEPELCIHNEDNSYSDELENILRHAKCASFVKTHLS